jgi:hypothetical protein
MEPKAHGTHPQWELSKDTKEHDLKHLGLVNLITMKQNKLPSFIDRCTIMYFRSLWIIGFIKEWTWF